MEGKEFSRSRAHRHIHRTLRKHSPHGVHKAKRLFAFKYPKLLLLAITILLSYYLFNFPAFSSWISQLGSLSYLGTFIAGILFSFGFTAPFSVGFFLTTNAENIFLATVMGGIGAMTSDLLIFKIIKVSFLNEFESLKKEKLVKSIRKIVYNHSPTLLKHYLLYVFAGIIISSPLPDEIGVSLLAGLTTISAKKLAIIGFILNSIGIFLILLIGKI